METFRSFCCCCYQQPRRHQRIQNINGLEDEDDYLLPGGDIEWDKSSKSFIQSHRLPRPGYVPPAIPTDSVEIPTIDQFRFLRTVGRGAFGKVMLGVHNPSRTLYAIKAVPKVKITTEKQMRQIVTELQILRKVKHPFCVSLQFAFQNDDLLFYVFEFAAGGMLFYHLREDVRFNETRARFYFGEIILALEYLHGFGIIFRDLKPENCMLSAIGHIVLTDFGSAKELDDGERTATLAGTPQYMAPEVLRGEPYSYSADWWSCGIILYEMLVGKTPFNSSDRIEMYRAVLRGSFKIPFYVSSRARSLLYKLIEKDPEMRLGYSDDATRMQSAAEIKEHNFFSMLPVDPDEESRYMVEETERQRHQQALERTRGKSRAISTDLGSSAGNIVRRLSSSAARFTGSHSLQGMPCTWQWEDLAAKAVEPPFTPRLSHPTDCSYFDPVMTSLPPTLMEFSIDTPGRQVHIEGFNYSAPKQPLEDPMTDST